MNEGTHTTVLIFFFLIFEGFPLEQSVIIYIQLKFSPDTASTSSVRSCVSVGVYRQSGVSESEAWLRATWFSMILPLHWAVKVITTFPSVVNFFCLSDRRRVVQAETHVYPWWIQKVAESHISSFDLIPRLPLSLSLRPLKGSKGKCGQLLPFDLQGLPSS